MVSQGHNELTSMHMVFDKSFAKLFRMIKFSKAGKSSQEV